jgi:hypothetical protein
LAGFRSRRITGEHRVAYAVEGKPDVDQRIIVIRCRRHYWHFAGWMFIQPEPGADLIGRIRQLASVGQASRTSERVT